MTLDSHPYRDALFRLRGVSLFVGGLGALAAAVGLFVGGEQFFHGYLVAFVFWVGLSLGSLAVLMLHHLTAGEWGFITQRSLEAAALTIPLMAVLFVPLFFGMHAHYEWTHAEAVAGSPALAHKRPYLNAPFWVARQVVYFVVWSALAFYMARWSRRLEETKDDAYAVKLRRLAAGGLVAHIVLLTFASVDWTMSLDPEWFSTIYPWLMLVSQALTAICLSILYLCVVERRMPHARVVRTKHVHDHGNLLLVFVVLWTYMMFFQYLIVWSGNVPEDVAWYVERQDGRWAWVAPVLVVLHFVIPFAVLLSRRAKRSRRVLPSVAALVLAAHLVYVTYLVLPSLPDANVHAYWIGAAAFVGIGGLWLAAWSWHMGRRPPLPRYDPRFEELLERTRATR